MSCKKGRLRKPHYTSGCHANTTPVFLLQLTVRKMSHLIALQSSSSSTGELKNGVSESPRSPLSEKSLYLSKTVQPNTNCCSDAKNRNTEKKLSPSYKREWKGNIFIPQNKVVTTRCYHQHIIQDSLDLICKQCCVQPETMRHLMVGCPQLV